MERRQKLGASALLLIFNTACGSIRPTPEQSVTGTISPTESSKTLTYDPLNPDPNDQNLWTCSWDQPPADAGTIKTFIDTWEPQGQNPLRVWWVEAGCQTGPGIKPDAPAATDSPTENRPIQSSSTETAALAFIETHTNAQEVYDLLVSEFEMKIESDYPLDQIGPELWAIYYAFINLPKEITSEITYFPHTLKILHQNVSNVNAQISAYLSDERTTIKLIVPTGKRINDLLEGPYGRTIINNIIAAASHEVGHEWLAKSYSRLKPWIDSIKTYSPNHDLCAPPLGSYFTCDQIDDEEFWALWFGILATNPDSVPEYVKEAFRADFPTWR